MIANFTMHPELALPAGTYKNTCTNCTMAATGNNSVLSCMYCRRDDGNWASYPDTFNLFVPYCGTNDIKNVNGKLAC